MFHHVDSKNKTIHIYVFFYIIFSSQANLGQLMMYVMTQHLTDSHFVTYNFFYHAMVFNLSWDHPRSNTLYSNLSWDVLLLLYVGSSKVQYPVLQVTTNKLTALPNLLLVVERQLNNDELKNDARSWFHFFSPFFVNLTVHDLVIKTLILYGHYFLYYSEEKWSPVSNILLITVSLIQPVETLRWSRMILS